jgi:hypothetical protein
MNAIQLDDLTPLKQFLAKHPTYKMSSIRWWIHRSQPRKGSNGMLPANGFAGCYTRKSGRILLIEPKVLEWLMAPDMEENDND